MIGVDKIEDIRRRRSRGESIASISRNTGVSEPEPCQYNGQRSRRFLCGQHGFRIGLEGTLEAVEELLHGLCRHAVPDGLVRAEAVVI